MAILIAVEILVPLVSARFSAVGCPLLCFVLRLTGFILFKFTLEIPMQGCRTTTFTSVTFLSPLAFSRHVSSYKASKAEPLRFGKFLPCFGIHIYLEFAGLQIVSLPAYRTSDFLGFFLIRVFTVNLCCKGFARWIVVWSSRRPHVLAAL